MSGGAPPRGTAAGATLVRLLPGIAVAGAAALVSWGIAGGLENVPMLTVAVVLGLVLAQLPGVRPILTGVLAPGLAFSSKTLLRAGIVLLGLQLSLSDLADLGWVAILTTVLVVVLAFFGTWGLGRLARLPGEQPILLAAGFSICGASAIGAMSAAVGAKRRDQAVPVALVTLFGTLAIAVLPALAVPLGLTPEQFGHWVGASVHDVGQVVATAQILGPAALAIAVVVKLTRVLLLAPMVAIVAGIRRRRTPDATGTRPSIVPLFLVGFVAAVLVRSFVPIPDAVLDGANVLQTALLAMALFAIGTSVRITELARTGWKAALVGLAAWALIALLGYGAALVG
ncbi:YeiH family protein [Agromyces seonyuensis]|uniref:Putative sulfate exporter family transporter n=1 Tax=Agromyces seonyuensis TaxID=2662446 RepID=A0A6I4NXM7_9MICO|nr:putative sulfate exporter family transporter [Agromyces seonyuensis]MWB98998.1 putative sulfate exporter family transporter [Agromyces seonyuensis]